MQFEEFDKKMAKLRPLADDEVLEFLYGKPDPNAELPDLSYSAIDASRDFKSLTGGFPSDNYIVEFCRASIGGSALGAAEQYFQASFNIYTQFSDTFRRTDNFDKTIDIIGKTRLEKGYKWAVEARKYYSVATEFCPKDRMNESQLSYKHIEKVEEGLRLACKKPKSCFIATACCDSAFAPEVIFLKGFRDNIMQRSVLGTAVIKIYYMLSPPIARFISRHFYLKKIVRACIIRPIVAFISALWKPN
jgi:hypothetical protein